MTPALQIRGLSVAYPAPGGAALAVRDLDLTLDPGEALGLVGESGCGKSTVAFACLRHLPEPGRVTAGEVLIGGTDIHTLGPEALRQVRGRDVAMIYQDPATALNPVLRIGLQLHEALAAHRKLPRDAARAELLAILARVRLPDPEAILRRYPHQLSGGQLQRVVIAMALLARPRLLVLDEPTTGLDVTVEAEVLDLVAEISREDGMAMLHISHDLGTVARICDRVAVMYAGRIVEEGPVRAILDDPRHPYTRALLACLPGGGGGRMSTIPGQPPPLSDLPPGCSFAPRCTFAEAGTCDLPPAPAAVPLGNGRSARCRRLDSVPRGPSAPGTTEGAEVARSEAGPAPALRIDGVTRRFEQGGWLARVTGRAPAPVRALDGAGFDVPRGRMVALVGESGSGKSTLARILIGLDIADGGHAVWKNGPDLAHLPARARPAELIRAVQNVFQNPDATLNPAHRVNGILGRAVRTMTGRRDPARVAELLEMVRLSPEIGRRRPGALSGGQRQRVAIARAFAGQPELVIADEPVSALDVSVQAAIVNLLSDMQEEAGTAVLFISHDLALVRHVADMAVVLYRGEVMEAGPVAQVFDAPSHPYTETLVAAASGRSIAAPVEADRPPPARGCPFAPRCHRHIGEVCETTPPPRQPDAAGHVIACHHDRAALLAPAPQKETHHGA